MTPQLLTALLTFLLCGIASSQDAVRTGPEAATHPLPQPQDYTLLWWADGPPAIRESPQPPATQTLCLQSGSWGVAIDTKNVRILRAGRWASPMSMDAATQPGRASLTVLPAAEWDLVVISDGRRFSCSGHLETEEPFLQPIRFVESGRFFQRVIIEGLRFTDDTGTAFPCTARLEISAWPDRLALRLEVETETPTNGSTVEMRLGAQRAAASLTSPVSLPLTIFDRPTAPRISLTADPDLATGYDESLGCHTLKIPDRRKTKTKAAREESFDHLDRWPLTLRNDSDQPLVARLMFVQDNPPGITGFTPMLCDPDGTPTGLPVQNSKNWHQRPDKGVLPHQGPWFHGFAYVRMAPKSERPLLFQIVHARYGGVFAASLAQLSLIGWGTNQFWDQAAIGSFGESICFEPGRAQRRCFIDDIRPLLTLADKPFAKPWTWADNCGGGDFLMWQNPRGIYEPMRATRTDYRSYGPCLTRARYTEESTGGEISARMDVSVPRSQDHLRTFLHFRYDIHRPIQWKRLAFFQLGADFYNNTPSRRAAMGDNAGLHEEWTPQQADGIFDRVALPMTGPHPWVSLHGLDRATLTVGNAAASRGFIVRRWQAVMGGQPVATPHVSFFCTRRGKSHRTVAELAPPPGLTSLQPGDFIEAEVELVVFPANAAAYYGPDKSFHTALTTTADTWQPVHREAAGNALRCESRRGTVLSPYPLAIAVDPYQTADLTIHGGLGHIPVTFTGLQHPRGWTLLLDGEPIRQAVHGNDWWQTDFDPATRLWQQTYNLSFPPGATHTLSFTNEVNTPATSPR